MSPLISYVIDDMTLYTRIRIHQTLIRGRLRAHLGQVRGEFILGLNKLKWYKHRTK